VIALRRDHCEHWFPNEAESSIGTPWVDPNRWQVYLLAGGLAPLRPPLSPAAGIITLTDLVYFVCALNLTLTDLRREGPLLRP